MKRTWVEDSEVEPMGVFAGVLKVATAVSEDMDFLAADAVALVDCRVVAYKVVVCKVVTMVPATVVEEHEAEVEKGVGQMVAISVEVLKVVEDKAVEIQVVLKEEAFLEVWTEVVDWVA